MNKLLTFPGKQPMFLGDIDFMQEAVKSDLQRLMQAYTGLSTPNAILFGVQFSYSGASVSWTSGVVCILGEILPVDAGSISDASSGLYFRVSSFVSGSRTFGNGIERSCWETRFAEITTTETYYPVSGFKRVAPVDTTDPQVYNFDGFVNTATNYARLVNCGGAWNLSLQRQEMTEPSSTIFQGNVLGLPAGVLTKFSAPGSPSSIRTTFGADMVNPTLSTLVGAVISWSVVGDALRFVITIPDPVQLAAFGIRETLPIF